MKLVVDTNILLKALIRNSRVRALLLSPTHSYMVPEHGVEETRRHMSTVTEKSGLPEAEVNVVFDVLLSNMEVIPSMTILAKWREGEAEIGHIDKGDIPFLAASLAVECDGIWSDDTHLRRQKKVKVFTTKDVLGPH
ncbi:MAG: PIN domain-containing protein [Thaumarchaeota archaeon]|nr:PIN domain-containing protein [Nitrososphaerota archaeon]